MGNAVVGNSNANIIRQATTLRNYYGVSRLIPEPSESGRRRPRHTDMQILTSCSSVLDFGFEEGEGIAYCHILTAWNPI